MSLEGFSNRNMELGNNPEGIKNEYQNDLRQQYISTIKRLALQKMKSDLLFEGSLGATIRKFSSQGLDVSRESILKDIDAEINRQQMNFDVETLFQEQNPISSLGTIPREPAIEPVWGAENIRKLNSQTAQEIQNRLEMQEEKVKKSNYTEQEKQEIRNQMQQAQEQLAQTLEWAKQQPNVPQFTSVHNDIIEESPEWTRDRGVSGYSKPDIEQVKEGFNSQVQQEQEFDVIYDLEIKKLAELKKNNNPNYEVELANAIRKISSLTDKIPDVRGQIESDINFEMSIAPIEQVAIQEQPKTEVVPLVQQEETSKKLQEQENQMKNLIVQQIMNAMNQAGEFSFGDISIGERMNIMNNVRTRLTGKSIEDLQMLLSTYQEQNIQEENISSRMHR